nr:hypothetical protein Iba_chr02bCG14760 [Ipomoea batatas]
MKCFLKGRQLRDVSLMIAHPRTAAMLRTVRTVNKLCDRAKTSVRAVEKEDGSTFFGDVIDKAVWNDLLFRGRCFLGISSGPASGGDIRLLAGRVNGTEDPMTSPCCSPFGATTSWLGPIRMGNSGMGRDPSTKQKLFRSAHVRRQWPSSRSGTRLTAWRRPSFQDPRCASGKEKNPPTAVPPPTIGERECSKRERRRLEAMVFMLWRQRSNGAAGGEELVSFSPRWSD